MLLCRSWFAAVAVARVLHTMSLTLLGTLDTVEPADSVLLLPVADGQLLFICATYHLLDGNTQAKAGGLVIGRVEPGASGCGIGDVQRVPSPYGGILDLGLINDQIYMATSSGIIARASVSDPSDMQSISQMETMALDVDLSGAGVASSYADGTVLFNGSSWKAHTESAWCCRIDPGHGSFVYSGGDDGYFRLWDTRASGPSWSSRHPSHLGITSLVLDDEKTLASGGYDQHIYLWDQRSMSRPLRCLNDDPLGGGIWRLSWSQDSRHILAACMHGGLAVIDTLESSSTKAMTHDQGIVYGTDWIPMDPLSHFIATCTFYSHNLSFFSYRQESD